MSKVKRGLKSIGFVSIYVAIYYIISIIVSAAFYSWKAIGGLSLSGARDMMRNNMYSLTVVTWIISVLCYYLIGKIRRQPINSVVKKEKTPLIFIAIAIAFAFGCRFLVSVYYSLATNVEILKASIEAAEETMPLPETTSQLRLALLCILIFAPCFEELLFRGLIMGELLKSVRPWMAIFLQAVIFGVMHGVLFQSIFTFVAGLALGFVYYRTKNIRLSILFHCIFNFSSIFMQEGLPVPGIILYLVAGIMLCGLSVFYICLRTKKDSWI